MYDELVKRCKALTDYNGVVSDEMIQEAFDCVKEATNAIENMSEAYDKLSRHMDDLAALMPRWIPVSERLPEYGTVVLVYGSRGGVYTAQFERARSEWDRDHWWKLNSKSHVCNPTHWMPLPEPPKEE